MGLDHLAKSNNYNHYCNVYTFIQQKQHIDDNQCKVMLDDNFEGPNGRVQPVTQPRKPDDIPITQPREADDAPDNTPHKPGIAPFLVLNYNVRLQYSGHFQSAFHL